MSPVQPDTEPAYDAPVADRVRAYADVVFGVATILATAARPPLPVGTIGRQLYDAAVSGC